MVARILCLEQKQERKEVAFRELGCSSLTFSQNGYDLNHLYVLYAGKVLVKSESGARM